MLDEIIILETPPLYSCYARRGEQKSIPIIGGHARRIVHGAINIGTGDIALLITPTWNRFTHQDFLQVIRRHWRGWQIVLFEDRGTPHTAQDQSRLCGALRPSTALSAAGHTGIERDGSVVATKQRARSRKLSNNFH